MSVLLVLLIKLWYIQSQLIPIVYEEIVKRLDANDSLTLPMPGYLKGEIPGFMADPALCFCISIHPVKLSFSYLFTGVVPSRQDLLFWFDSFGIGFIKGVVQGLSVSMCL